MNNKLIGWYSMLLGISVILLWTFILNPAGQKEGKIEMGFHLMSEFLMACFCIVSGIKILLKHREAFLINSVSHGMVIYSVANAAGYYGERGDKTMMVMFLILFSISLIIIVHNLRGVYTISRDTLK
jgi:hypothetical protein